MSECTREKPCTRWGYEYWADEDGEHKGAVVDKEAARRTQASEIVGGILRLGEEIADREREIKGMDKERRRLIKKLKSLA